MATVDTAGVNVSDAILHLLEPEDAGFAPSERALSPLSDPIREFLAGHVAHGISDSQIKGARFASYAEDAAPGILQRLVGGVDFVTDSQALARCAYEIMAADRRIRPPGSLAVVRYALAANPDETQVAALKLDRGGRFRWIQRSDEGVSFWDLEETSDVAPSTGERLHKAVFVGPINRSELTGTDRRTKGQERGKGHEFLVLDRQVRSGADWWLSRFLLAAPALTDDERANRFVKGALAGKNCVFARLSRDERESVDLAIRSALSSSTVNVNEWVGALAMSEELKRELRSEIDQRLPDNQFIVTETVRKKYGRSSWVGDNGLRVAIDAAYASQVKSKQVRGGWEIQIRTSRWDEVT